jgi:hypothetical protein
LFIASSTKLIPKPIFFGATKFSATLTSVRRKLDRESKRNQLTVINQITVRSSNMLKQVSLGVALAFALPSIPAMAQSAPAEENGKAADPKRKICEKIEVTGSRVKARKICMTVEQWEAQRRDSREELERAQKNAGVPKSS